MEYEFGFLKALLLTIVIETSVLILLFRMVFKTLQAGLWILLLTGIVATMATLPYLWFIVPLFVHSKFWYIIVCEGFAVGMESVVIMGMLRINYFRALLISFICNAVSYSTGLLINFY
jgi:hypothetical protein